MKNSFVIVTLLVFASLNMVFYALNKYVPEFQFAALEIGNIIMACLCLLSFFIVRKQMEGRPEAFVRGVYSASFLKLMVCMVSILVYVLLNRSHIHKPSVFMLFGIYIIYTIMETWLLSKIVRE
jgi:hypothetical protein